MKDFSVDPPGGFHLYARSDPLVNLYPNPAQRIQSMAFHDPDPETTQKIVKMGKLVYANGSDDEC